MMQCPLPTRVEIDICVDLHHTQICETHGGVPSIEWPFFDPVVRFPLQRGFAVLYLYQYQRTPLLHYAKEVATARRQCHPAAASQPCR